jgi:hypothetical protein
LRRPGGGREVRAVAAAYRLPLPIRFPMGSPPRNVLRLDPRSERGEQQNRGVVGLRRTGAVSERPVRGPGSRWSSLAGTP